MSSQLDGGGEPGDEFASLRQECVDAINRYRAEQGLPALIRDTGGEACADSSAASDSETGVPHGAFRSCPDARAQNECPGYPEPVSQSLSFCLSQMWGEKDEANPAGRGHYDAMSSTKYTTVACGFHMGSGGQWWMLQNYK